MSAASTMDGRSERRPEARVSDLLLAVGEAQRNRYRSEGPMAQGGMGTIQRVLDRPLVRFVARKIMHDHLASHRDHVEMFLREARLTGQLDHPNVVPVHELGVDDRGRLFFTMKLVEGRTLSQWIDELPRYEALDRSTLFDLLDVVLKVCDALAFAHSRGVIHGDVKPANVMVGEYGQVYLMDWGVARLILEEEARAKKVDDDDERVIGTPSHMPPEQARGLPLDSRADVFATGALLYHVLTRRAPFGGDGEIQVMAGSILCRFPHPDEVMGPGVVPPPLTRIVLRAMAASPEERYATIRELKDDLVRYVRGGESFDALVFEPGAVIVREGEPGEEAFIIESGRCEVARGGTPIRVMGPGEVFGEMAILSPGLRTATVRALSRSVLRRVTAEALRHELDSMKPWMGALVRKLAERFREREEER